MASHVADEEFSVGDYVLTGGEIPAMILVDSVSRQIPGVLGKEQSLEEQQGSYPTYTRPVEVVVKSKTGRAKKLKVPQVLMGGNHAEIEKWRKEHGGAEEVS